MIANDTTLHKRTKLTTKCHYTAFNNEQIPYRIVSYKKAQKCQCKTVQGEN